MGVKDANEHLERRKRVRCDCAHASMLCGSAQMWMSALFSTAHRGHGPRRDAGSTSSRQEEAPRRSTGDPRTPLATSSRGGLTAVRVQPGL